MAVEGLLQLATFLIYANRMSINGFEHKFVRERTEEAAETLYDLNLEKDAFLIQRVDRNAYDAACESAAERAIVGIAGATTLGNLNITSSLEPPELPSVVSLK